MLVFYCSATNPHKQWVKRHSVWSCGVLPESSGRGDWFLCSGPIRLKSTRLRCHPRQQFYWDLGLLPSSLLAAEFSFLAAVGLNFLAGFCWDLPDMQSLPWAVATLFTSWPRGGSLLFLLSLTSIPSLKGLVWLGHGHPDTLSSDWLQVNWLGTLVTSQNPSTSARWRN